MLLLRILKHITTDSAPRRGDWHLVMVAFSRTVGGHTVLRARPGRDVSERPSTGTIWIG
jgi:hypothetical protein